MAKSTKLGGGGRFERMAGEMKKEGMKNPDAVAASIGMKKYGKGKMEAMAQKGRTRSK